MKNIFSGSVIALLLLTAYSCSKESPETGPLVGDWNVVNDSSFNTNKIYLLSLGESGVTSSNYIGEQCPATFNIDSNGTIRTSFYNCTYAFPSVDSAIYVVAGNQIAISIFAQNAGCCGVSYLNPAIKRTYTISNLTTNTLTLTFESGIMTEIINLKK